MTLMFFKQNIDLSSRYIGKQIGRLLVKAGTIVSLEDSDPNSFHDDLMYQWAGKRPQPSTPNLRNGSGSPSKIGSWKSASPGPETGSTPRAGAKYTEAEMQQALVIKQLRNQIRSSSISQLLK
jgi:hypothetical protein